MKLLTATDLFSKKDLDDLQMWMLRNRAEQFSWIRVVIGPLVGATLLFALVGDEAIWRRWILGAMAALIVVRSLAEITAGRRRRGRVRRLPEQRMGAVAGILPTVGAGVFILATGGFDSPVLPMLLPMAFFMGMLAERRVLATLVVGSSLLVALLAAIATRGWIPDVVPAILGGASAAQPAVLVYAKAFALICMLGWVGMGASLVRYVFRRIAGDAIDARDEVLNNHDAHIQELTALSGEIAHELKNPLANIKGLGVLVSRDVQGRTAERVGVLLHEVDRMEAILHEFLTFSRPLVPLSEEGVDLKELCDLVVALHEGLAHGKDVSIDVRADAAVHASGDPRKLKQVLINLVQNALEASPRGSVIEIAIGSDERGGGRVEVRDRGPGLSPEVKAHLFEPGVTTKERGSGLGLALARGLARQHGGELSVDNRDGGGCVARLSLPAALTQAARTMA